MFRSLIFLACAVGAVNLDDGSSEADLTEEEKLQGMKDQHADAMRLCEVLVGEASILKHLGQM